MPDKRQPEGVLGLVRGSARPPRRARRPEPSPSGSSPGSVATLAGDRLDLVRAGQVVVDDDELPLQLDGELDDGGEDDDEGPVTPAGDDPGVECLDDLGRAEEPVEVAEHEQGRAVGRGQGGSRRGSRPGGRSPGVAWRSRQNGRPPERPRSTSQVARDQFSCAAEGGRSRRPRHRARSRVDVNAAERGAHQLAQALGERHGWLLLGVVGYGDGGGRDRGVSSTASGPGGPPGPGGTRR